MEIMSIYKYMLIFLYNFVQVEEKFINYAVLQNEVRLKVDRQILSQIGRTIEKNTSCYNKKILRDLKHADKPDFTLPEDSIFFVESSCRGVLNERQACSVESAARAHPHRKVVIFFVAPVPEINLEDPIMKALKLYSNILFYRIHVDKYVRDTPLEYAVTKFFKKSYYPIEHMANILKYLTLYKFGGISLDLDVIVVQPFDSLPETKNWIGVEDFEANEYGAGLIAASKEKAGRRFINTIVSYLMDDLKPTSWTHSANGVAELALAELCDTPYWIFALKNTSFDCKGVAVYEQRLFYPINFYDAHKIFTPQINLDELLVANEPYAMHMYNAITKKYVINRDSCYAKIMERFCPRVDEAFKLKEIKRKEYEAIKNTSFPVTVLTSSKVPTPYTKTPRKSLRERKLEKRNKLKGPNNILKIKRKKKPFHLTDESLAYKDVPST